MPDEQVQKLSSAWIKTKQDFTTVAAMIGVHGKAKVEEIIGSEYTKDFVDTPWENDTHEIDTGSGEKITYKVATSWEWDEEVVTWYTHVSGWEVTTDTNKDVDDNNSVASSENDENWDSETKKSG